MAPATETRNDAVLIRDSYDRVANPYATAFGDELAHKPLDRALLATFADEVRGRGPVAELGCGPGQIARHLHADGVTVVGIDLAPGMIEQARTLAPALDFRVGDFRALELLDDAVSGIVAFYAIVHLTRDELPPTFAEWRRVLAPGAPVLLGFHTGDETLCPADFFGAPTSMHWNFFPLAAVTAALAQAGLTVEAELERTPYPGEHPSRRGYVLARRPVNDVNARP